MFKLNNEAELRECFRLLDRDEVMVPRELDFPIVVKDYLNWLEPSGARAYLVFADRLGAAPLGVVFRRDQSAGSPPHAVMCEWCHRVRGGDGVGLLSATASSNRRVGLPLCRDLSCKEKAYETPGANDFPEAGTPHEKVKRIVGRMGEFARRQLF